VYFNAFSYAPVAKPQAIQATTRRDDSKIAFVPVPKSLALVSLFLSGTKQSVKVISAF
jgi:hypothetical protein